MLGPQTTKLPSSLKKVLPIDGEVLNFSALILCLCTRLAYHLGKDQYFRSTSPF